MAQTLTWEALDPVVRAAITTPMISDSLDAIGIRHQVLDGSVEPLDPRMRAIGRAATVQFAPTGEDTEHPYDDAIDFIDSLREGDLVVVAADGSPRSAYWGELFSAAATGRGAVGTVCDSFARDTPKIRSMGYPVFSRGARPIDYRARMRIVGAGVPVTCAGVLIAPRDLVAADGDGVVVVPQASEHEVLERAVTRATAESNVLRDLLEGVPLGEVWVRYGVL